MFTFKAYNNTPVRPDKLEKIRHSFFMSVNTIQADGNTDYKVGGYPLRFWNNCLKERINNLKLNSEATIAIVNDLVLELVNHLMISGFKKFTVVATDNNIESKINRMLNKAYNYNKEAIDIEIVTLEEFLNMGKYFDLIIANPPFALGKEITAKILNNVEFKSYINLMPISEYEKIIDKDNNSLSNYEEEYEQISKKDSLKIFDCNCPPLEIGVIKKTIQNNFSKLERLCRKNTFLCKWFELNRCRNANYSVYGSILRNSRYGIKEHAAAFCPDSLNRITDDFFNSSIVFGMYFVSNGIHNDAGKAIDNFWNYKLNSIQDFKDKVIELNASPDLHCLKFNTHIEKVNCNNWMRNQKLYSYMLSQLDNAGSIDVIKEIIIPKVDWTRAWTDEEILADYGYTKEEIEEILRYNDDLIPNNSKEESTATE